MVESVGGRAALGVAASLYRRAPEAFASVGRRALRPRGAEKNSGVVPLPRARSVRLRLTIRAFPRTQVCDVVVASLSAPRGGAVGGVPSLLGAAPLRLRLRGFASSPPPRWCRPLVAPAAFAAFGLRRPLALLAPAAPSLRPLPLRRRSSLSHPVRPPSGGSLRLRLRSPPAVCLPCPPRRFRRYGRSSGSPPCACAPQRGLAHALTRLRRSMVLATLAISRPLARLSRWRRPAASAPCQGDARLLHPRKALRSAFRGA